MTDKEKLTVVVFSDDLDRALAAFGIAVTAASMGMDVTMAFTFWGLNILRKSKNGFKGKGLLRRIVNLVNRGGPDRLGLSKHHMLGLGPWAMKRLMKDSKMPSIDEFITMAKDMGVRLVICTGTWGPFGFDKDSFRTEVDAIGGTAYWLEDAAKSKLAFFI
ncbi:MAG: DsrE/DsrF/DrsH-like family protein [Dehalococcoidia bacterium]